MKELKKFKLTIDKPITKWEHVFYAQDWEEALRQCKGVPPTKFENATEITIKLLKD